MHPDSVSTDLLCPPGGWASPSQPRLRAPAPSRRGPLFRSMALVSGLFGRAEVPDVLTVLNINPRLFWAWLFFASRLMPFGKLPATVREKVILRTGWNCRSRYEWGQHVEIALGAGVSDLEILQVSQGPEAFTDRREQALMRACDEMLRDRLIADATWNTLKESYSEKLLIEIILLIGHYEMIAGFLNTAGITLEPAIETVLQDCYGRIARLPV
jgi:alkylhydroperoxidase family enzyme